MRTMLRRARRRLRLLPRDESGTQLVELALVLPILLALFAATAEFGRYFHSYSTLAKSTRAGARMLATTTLKDVAGAGLANNLQDARIRRLVVYGDPNAAEGSRPVVPGLKPENVELVREGPILTVPNTVTVRIVNYNYTPVINLGSFSDKLNWTSVPLKPSTTMRFMLTQPTPPSM
jgi:Flp pilus assembly protein TadG